MRIAYFLAGSAFLYCALNFLTIGSTMSMWVWAVAAFFIAGLLFLTAVFPKGLS